MILCSSHRIVYRSTQYVFFIPSPLQFYLRKEVFFSTVEVLFPRRIHMCPLMEYQRYLLDKMKNELSFCMSNTDEVLSET